MKKLAFISLMLCSSCSHHFAISTHRSDVPSSRLQLEDQDIAKINAISKQRSARILLANGTTARGKQVQVFRDQVTWLDGKSEELRTVPLEEVKKIIIFRHGKGAAQGFGLGALAGFSAGFLLGALTADEDAFLFSDPGEVGFLAGTILGLPLGMLIGATAGATNGDRTHFEFEALPPPNLSN